MIRNTLSNLSELLLENLKKRMSAGSEPQESGCIHWMRARNKNGYGSICVSLVMQASHRVAYMLSAGDIPLGMHVLHTCDNRQCVNPRHLFLGTNQDNCKDKVAKGRSLRGEKSGRAKLNADQVRAIRASKGTQAQIAADYGIQQTTVSAIKRGRSWAHLPASDLLDKNREATC